MLQKKKEHDKQVNIDEEVQKNKILKGVDTDKKHQHDKLMDEFRKAHRKMFSSTLNNAIKDEDQHDRDNENVKTEKETTITVSDILSDNKNNHHINLNWKKCARVPGVLSCLIGCMY